MSAGRMRIPSYTYVTYIILPTADMLPQTQDIGHKPLLWGLWPMSFPPYESVFCVYSDWSMGIIQPDKPCGMLLLGFSHTFYIYAVTPLHAFPRIHPCDICSRHSFPFLLLRVMTTTTMMRLIVEPMALAMKSSQSPERRPPVQQACRISMTPLMMTGISHTRENSILPVALLPSLLRRRSMPIRSPKTRYMETCAHLSMSLTSLTGVSGISIRHTVHIAATHNADNGYEIRILSIFSIICMILIQK